MAALSRLGRISKRPLFRSASPVRQFTQSNFQPLDSNDKFEEETLPWYTPDSSYAVKVGEVFQSRYQVIGKLGYGGYSTVWLCRDLTINKYVTLKVFKRDSAEGKREVKVYDHLHTSNASHDGAMFVRTALNSFQIDAQGLDPSRGFYQCIVHQPLGISLYDLRIQFAAKILPEKLVKLTLLHLLLALDYLHTEFGVIHTEISNPSRRKIVGNRVIYLSRKLKKTKQHGRPILCDFGHTRFGSARYSGDIQPYIYRAPEVLLRMPWDQKVDIWNIGVVTWDLFQQGHLFYGRDSRKQNSDVNHIAEMIAVLGPPPRDMLHRIATTLQTSLMLKGAAPIPPRALEQLEGNLQGEQQQLFLAFMRKMLRWRPEERSSARDLLSD
ncbi:kinase-like domain-containing protein [Penicillium concentricum]|uniref:Kinase-like domain-containing protein n=1 Tax=Penicillium concentricum TaxID=293559 RepID=A0A9W9UUE0_9EURO|nr:kinase-like domain-containing protein [Penicillium concentricum]KAJ5355810.1 kinase-like domain-containing protein [Penicillium concentricum]